MGEKNIHKPHRCIKQVFKGVFSGHINHIPLNLSSLADMWGLRAFKRDEEEEEGKGLCGFV